MLAPALYAMAQPQHSFTDFTRGYGLASSTMQDIVQDRDGFIWLASWGGIYCFDGDNFTNYKTSSLNDRGNLRSNRFIDLDIDTSGRLWALAFDYSLYYMDTRERVLQLAQCGDYSIRRIIRLASGQVCLIAADNTLLFPREDRAGEIEFTASRLIPVSSSLTDIFQDGKGFLWMLTDEGLYRERQRIDPTPVYCAAERDGILYFGGEGGQVLIYSDRAITLKQTAFHSDISLMIPLPDRDGWLVGSTAEGVYVYDDALEKSQFIGHPCYPIGALHSVQDKRGNLWIYSASGGLDWYDPDGNRLVPFFDSSVQKGWNHENRLACVMMDNQGDRWFSSFPGGLEEAVFPQGRFQFKSFSNAGSGNGSNVRSLCLYGDRLLVGTRDGRIHLLDDNYNPGAYYQFDSPAYTITCDSSGRIWVGTREHGLSELPLPAFPRTKQPILYPRSEGSYAPNANQIYSLREGPGKRLWVASFDDALSYVDLSLETRDFISNKNHLHFPSTERQALRCLAFGPDGTLYTGGQIGLFACNNPDANPSEIKFTQFSKVENYDIQDILISREGRLYACSYGNGFLAFDSFNPSSGLREYTIEDGFLSNFILAAKEDDDGTIWIATEGGLNRFDPISGSIVGYSYERLGFPIRFNEGSILKGPDGTLYFNTTTGIFFFHPRQVALSSFVPELHLLSCRSGRRTISPDSGETIRMRTSEQLRLEYAAVDMAAPGRILYSYRIDGTDKDWVSIGAQNNLTLGPFKSGRHRVFIRSTNGDGLTMDNVRELDILAIPHPLSSIWAQLSYLLILLSAGTVLLLRKKRETLAQPEENPYLRGLQGDDRKLIANLLELLEDKLDDATLDMDAMAEAMHMSRSALFKKTKALVSKSPMDLLREMRMDRARSLVSSGGYTIAQIAYMTGFNDTHYFSKVFKKETGLTPTVYRNQNNTPL